MGEAGNRVMNGGLPRNGHFGLVIQMARDDGETAARAAAARATGGGTYAVHGARG